MPAISTKERILDAAIHLFNERGTASVSTNHIAAEAGLSPGNLYYYYGDKEDIIRAVFNRLDRFWDASYVLPADRMPTLDDLRSMVEETYVGLWNYRFFYRELGALIGRDAELGQQFRVVRERGLAGTESLLHTFVAAGVLAEPEDPAALPELAETLMLIVEFWLPFEESGRVTPEPERIRDGAGRMMRVLRPRLRQPTST